MRGPCAPSPQDIRIQAPARTFPMIASTLVVVNSPVATSSSQRVAMTMETSCFSGQVLRPGFWPYASSAVNHLNGTPAAIARSSIIRACTGLVACRRRVKTDPLRTGEY